MTSKHTPGPWLWSEADYHNESVAPWTITTLNGDDFCTLYSDENAIGPNVSREESIANARLIAAAPETKRQRDELLEAAKALVDTNRSEKAYWAAVNKLCDAIAKAEGR